MSRVTAQTLMVGDTEVAWHAVDTIGYNVNLYHFAYALNKPTSNVLFWVVTVVNAPREMSGRPPGHRIERRVRLVGQRSAGHRHLQRPPDGDRRRRVEAIDAEARCQCRSRRDHQRRRRDRLLRAVPRRRGPADQGHHREAFRAERGVS